MPSASYDQLLSIASVRWTDGSCGLKVSMLLPFKAHASLPTFLFLNPAVDLE
jgi:hypothetical protein